MGRNLIIITAFLIGVMSCSKDPAVPIEFTITGSGLPTKTVSEVNTGVLASGGFNVSALKSDGVFLFKNQVFTKNSSGSYSGGKYWPMKGSLSFYASNAAAAKCRFGYHSSSCAEIRADGENLDLVSAKAENVSNGSSVNLSFNHIMARLYAVSLESSDGSVISINSITVSYSSTGWYCLDHGIWTQQSSGSSCSFPSELLSVGDILMIPGEITITVNYNAEWDGHLETHEKSADVILAAGEKTSVCGKLGADYGAIDIHLNVEPWDSGDILQFEM